ncbi:lipopolysaccharide biosynthesis protein [Marinagarivorans algicola]|uniref:lipopolysaccharide biosynthesis protein n=1 Tax=Marinagarivorans algicola TaxID=1513270 RepID=UPI0006B95D79|nr:hypothetical protein [Marinagarivorans algicola]
MVMVKRTFVYIFGEIIARIAPLALLPYLGWEYGASGLALYSTYILIGFFAQSIGCAWLCPYIHVMFFKRPSRYLSLIKLGEIVGWSQLLLSLVLLVVLYLNGVADEVLIFSCGIVLGAIQVFLQVALADLQLRGDAKNYVLLNSVRPITFVVIVYVALYFECSIPLPLLVLSNIALSGVCVIPAMLLIRKRVCPVTSLSNFRLLAREAWGFGLPLLPGVLMMNFRTAVDRVVLGSFYGVEIVGAYVAAYQLSSVVMVLSSGLVKALGPIVMKCLSVGDVAKVKKLVLVYALILLVNTVVVFGLLTAGFGSIAGEEFSDLHGFEFLIFGLLCQCVAGFLTAYFQYYRKTKFLLQLNIIFMAVYCCFAAVGGGISISAFVSASFLFSFITSCLVYKYGFKNIF